MNIYSDTNTETNEVLSELYRNMSDQDKMKRVSELSALVRNLARQEIANQNPSWSEQEIQNQFILNVYGKEVLDLVLEQSQKRTK